MVKESFSTQTEIIMKGTGAIIKLADMAFIFMKMEINTKESGKKMFSTAMEKSDGQTARVIKDHIIKELSME